jgi:DNA invertase Pin-like site-specific DNA recombinase
MLIGYARVSTDDQDLRLQRAALREAGCKKIYEKVSGAKRERLQLHRMLDHLKATWSWSPVWIGWHGRLAICSISPSS